jgi:TolA-binding protein
MGRKQDRTGKYIYLCVASLAVLFVLGCVTLIDKEDHLVRSERLIARGDFDGALVENQKLLSSYPNRPPGDEALFNMGLIYAHYGNPDKDYKKSIHLFNKLLERYPRSPLIEQVKIWIGVLQVIEKSKQVDIEIEEMKKEVFR